MERLSDSSQLHKVPSTCCAAACYECLSNAYRISPPTRQSSSQLQVPVFCLLGCCLLRMPTKYIDRQDRGLVRQESASGACLLPAGVLPATNADPISAPANLTVCQTAVNPSCITSAYWTCQECLSSAYCVSPPARQSACQMAVSFKVHVLC